MNRLIKERGFLYRNPLFPYHVLQAVEKPAKPKVSEGGDV
jgi:hypothetical protein